MRRVRVMRSVICQCVLKKNALLFLFGLFVASCASQPAVLTNANELGMMNQPIVQGMYLEAQELYRQKKISESYIRNIEESLTVQPQIQATSVADVFNKARELYNGNQVFVSDVVNVLIQKNYPSEVDAVSALKQDGFNVIRTDEKDMQNSLFRQQMKILKSDSDVYIAEKSGNLRYWIRDRWRVILYVKDGYVDRVSAQAKTR